MKKIGCIILLLAFMTVRSQNNDSLIVNYYENFPYAYTENGKLKGIEVDIIEEYVAWMKQKKNTNIIVAYRPFKEFSALYNSVKDGKPNVVGLGSITDNAERMREVSFSAPYLQNVAVLVTYGKVPTVRTKSQTEAMAVFGGLTATTIKKSSLEDYVNELRRNLLPSLQVNYAETQNGILDAIGDKTKSFGYVDIVAYWAYLKKNPTKYLKIQKTFNQSNQFFEFVLPKKNVHLDSINEFFEGGFGFTSTKKYEEILENYLGHEILESVEIK